MSQFATLLGLTAGLGGIGALCGIDGFLVEPNLLEVTRHEIPVPDLPESLDGYTIAQITDTHFGSERGAHRKTLDSIESLEPELVVCTGDLVETEQDLDEFIPYARELVEVSERIVGVLGNWEHRHGERVARRIAGVYEDLGLQVLSNEAISLESGIVVLGGDDPVTDRFDASRLFDEIPPGDFHLFLVHSPTVFDSCTASRKFDLSLAGHTHGG